ncbi:hypothetical protein HPB49_026649 [Dermacentor silvarum]|nr:hypothetical protein HPB49_026649 [Dermacentor silvarum]
MASKARTCFVPGCRSGYRTCKAKASLFRPPKDAVRRELWSRNIKRANKELTTEGVVCERHFELKYIERTFRHVIMGKQSKFHDIADFSLGQSPVQDKTVPNVERIW